MLKLASKFAMDILPSVIATIIGAYIVNHYINVKPAATAAAVSTADPKKAASRADSKPAEKSADLSNTPEPGVRAKGISEKAIIDKSATDKSVIEKPADKADRPSETASIPPTTPADSRRHPPAPREKAASKTAPPAVEPVVAAPVTAPPAETAATPAANDLARAAIERLRGAEPAPRVQEGARTPETPRVVVAAPATVPPAPAPAVSAPSLQPLPPPILVSTPPTDSKPPYPSAKRVDDPLHPTPPADIPDPQAPLDLRADAAVDTAPAKRPSVADDVLSAAKSMFHSVLPK